LQPPSSIGSHPSVLGKETHMGFSGPRAIVMVLVLVGLLVGVSRFDLPGWSVPVGLLGVGVLVRAWEKSASS
jgi:hypothetical protein